MRVAEPAGMTLHGPCHLESRWHADDAVNSSCSWYVGLKRTPVLQGGFPKQWYHCSHTGVCQERTSIFLYPSVCVEDRNNQSYLLQAETTLRCSYCTLLALPGQLWGNKWSLHPPLQLQWLHVSPRNRDQTASDKNQNQSKQTKIPY